MSSDQRPAGVRFRETAESNIGLKRASSIGNILSLASKPPSFTDLTKLEAQEAADLAAEEMANSDKTKGILIKRDGSSKRSLNGVAPPDPRLKSASRIDKLTSDLDEIHRGTALIRWWKPFVGLAWSFFIFFQISMALDREYHAEPLCPYSDRHYDSWYWSINYAVFGGFLFILSAIVMKLVQMRRSENKRVPLLVACNIVTMGSIATLLAVVFETGGVCVDVLNVASPAAIWGEWMACGPLLFFITFTVVDKPDLTKADCFFMIMFFVCLLTGFFIIPPQPVESGQFWLAVSCATYMPVLVVPWYEADGGSDGLLSVVSVNRPGGASNPDNERQLKMYAERFAMRYNLAMWLELVLPLYTVNYLVAVFGGIDYALTIVIYQVLSVLTKGLFAACTMDIHLDLLQEAEKALVEERRANEARRAFMKYIFHEVRTPLNSLTMGIDLLNMSENLDGLDRESLAMMKAASEFMSDTLDDVLSMQKIEEGKLELEMTPFSFDKAIKKVFATFRGSVTKKQISLFKSISPNTPARVIGDIHRIEHVISNLLSNAIKFSPEGKSIKLCITTESITRGTSPDKKDVAQIRVSIEDEGPGISVENQNLLFNNFVQIRPGALQSGHGSGLGLSFCKQIVQLHGGEIGISSEEGKGSKFYFIIPYTIYAYTMVDDIECSPQHSSPGQITCLHQSPQSRLSPRHSQPHSQVDTKAPPSPPGICGATGGLGNTAITPFSINMAFAAHNLVSNSTNDGKNKPDDSKFEVLVVDDADSNRKMLTMLLKRKGLVSETAENGLIAVNIVKEDLHRFKLVLMDNLMPEMNGVDAAKEMRSAGFPYLIAGITGNVMEDDIDEYLDAGADLVISKPLKRTTLDLLVKHIDDTDALSRPGMRLLEQVDFMEWVHRSKK